MDRFSDRPSFRIPFIDLAQIHGPLRKEVQAAIRRVTDRQWFLFGPEVDQFERSFADYCGSPYCVGVGSGFHALRLSLLALGLGPKDEVILPANTFVATFQAVVGVGAKPVLCDVDADTHVVTVDSVARVATARTRAIIPVHLFGAPAPVDELAAWSRRRKIDLVEDACQAHGATLNDKKVGTFGRFGAYSFYPGKNLGSFGDGGAILCKSSRDHKSLLKLREYGYRKKNYAETYGENSRLNEMTGAILSAKLPMLDSNNQERTANAVLYRKLMRADIQTQHLIPGADSCWHAFVVVVKNRDRLFRELRKLGIEVMIHYPWPIHRQPVYHKLGGKPMSFPISERLAKQILSLPVDVHMTRARIEEVAAHVNRLAT